MGRNPGSQQPNEGQSAQDGQSGQQPAQGQEAGQGRGPNGQRDTSERIASWFTETMVRTVVAIFGVSLVRLRLGQIAGVPLLEMVADISNQ